MNDVVAQACRQILQVAEDIKIAETLKEAQIHAMRLTGPVFFLKGYYDLDIEDEP